MHLAYIYNCAYIVWLILKQNLYTCISKSVWTDSQDKNSLNLALSLEFFFPYTRTYI